MIKNQEYFQPIQKIKQKMQTKNIKSAQKNAKFLKLKEKLSKKFEKNKQKKNAKKNKKETYAELLKMKIVPKNCKNTKPMQKKRKMHAI